MAAVAVRLVSCAANAVKSAPALRSNPRQSESISGSKGGTRGGLVVDMIELHRRTERQVCVSSVCCVRH